MLTGRQIKTARMLMGLHRSKLAERMGTPTTLVKLAEAIDNDCSLTIKRVSAFRSYFEKHGIEFLIVENEPAVRLQAQTLVYGPSDQVRAAI